MRALATLAVGSLALAIALLNHPAGRPPQEDAGIFLYSASRWLDGGLPYLSVWDHKPPGIYLVAALGLVVARGGIDGAWLVEALLFVAAAVVGHIALRRAFGLQAALFASAGWLLAAPSLFVAVGKFTLFAEFAALPLQFAALFLVTVRPRRARDLAVGALASCAFLLKPTTIGIWFALAVMTLSSARSPRFLPVLSRSVLGAALPIAAVAAYFGTRGGLFELWDQALVYNVVNGGTAPISDRVVAALQGFRLLLPSWLAAIVAVAWPAALLSLRRRNAHPLLLVGLIGFPVEVMLSSATGRPYNYYYLTWLPTAAILAAFLARSATELVGPRPIAQLSLAVVIVVMSIPTLDLSGRAAGASALPRLQAALDVVAARTSNDDAVFVWGSATEVLLLGHRIAPTRFVYQYAPLFTVGYADARRVSELLADLQRRPPVLIIDASVTSFATPPLDPQAMRTWTTPDPRYLAPPDLDRIASFVAERYERMEVLPDTGWVIYRLKGAGGLTRYVDAHRSATKSAPRSSSGSRSIVTRAKNGARRARPFAASSRSPLSSWRARV